MSESLFVSLIQENFSFLVEEYGFHVNNTNAMHWSRGKYNVKLSYDHNRSYELDLHIYYDDVEYLSPYSLCEIQQLFQLADIKDATYIYMASTSERLSQGIFEISSLFKNICEKIDIFNTETFAMLAIIRRNYSEECERKNKLKWMRIDAEKAWKEKDYPTIKVLYEPFLDDLTKSEIKKYEYALRHL